MTHPNGVVIHLGAFIDSNFLVFQKVTIFKGVEIGDRVNVGVGAKIFGNVTLAEDVNIGANAVVLSDIPSSATAVGIPAKIIRSTSNG